MDMYIEQSFFHDWIGRDRIVKALEPYWDWARALPDPLTQCHRELIQAEIANSNLVNLAFLLEEPFEISARRVIDKLVVANAFMLTYFLASDRLLDRPNHADRFMVPLATLLHGEMLALYEEILPGQAAGLWASLVRDHVGGIIEEEAHHTRCRMGLPGLDTDSYKQVVIRKNRYGSVGILLLAAATQRAETGRVLQQVYDHIAIEIELDDDLKDWREDRAEGRFTPVVLALAQAASSRAEDALRDALATSTVVSEFLDDIDAHLGRAESLLAEAVFPCAGLTGWLIRHREANRLLRRDVVAIQIRHALAAGAIHHAAR